MGFKDHFSAHAAIYREARPRYPHQLFAWLAANAPARGLAWDAGCGNGQAAVALAERFERVIATDPSATQIDEAEAHPRVEYRVEPAEASTLAERSVDLVTVAQALHWFEHARFYAEVRRVAAPGALVAAWCYALMRIDPAVDAVIDQLYEVTLAGHWPPERRWVEQGYQTLAFPFEPVTTPTFTMRHAWTLEQVMAYLESWSAVQRCRRETGVDPLGEVRAALLAHWRDPDEIRVVSWPLSLRAGRV